MEGTHTGDYAFIEYKNVIHNILVLSIRNVKTLLHDSQET